MTTIVDIINRALQSIGTRTTVSAAELAAQSSNEAIQASLILDSTRDTLSRMAPWNHCFTATLLRYLSSAGGTPENSNGSNSWQPGLPIPPWLYMYEYPTDCLRIVSLKAQPTNNPAGVPIYPVPTGIVLGCDSQFIKYKVGYNKYNTTGDFGPDFNADFGHGVEVAPGRVILTNQPQAILTYITQVTDPLAMDPLFQEAWVHVLASRLALALTGDKAIANGSISLANTVIDTARTADANEEPVIVDYVPDWLAVRGLGSGRPGYDSFDWGPLWPNA